MKYPNIQAAFVVQWMDNMPLRYPETAFSKIVAPDLEAVFGADYVARVDAEIGAVRQPDDTATLDSPLWQMCAGEDAETKCSHETNEVLNRMFEHGLGAAQDAQPGPVEFQRYM